MVLALAKLPNRIASVTKAFVETVASHVRLNFNVLFKRIITNGLYSNAGPIIHSLNFLMQITIRFVIIQNRIKS